MADRAQPKHSNPNLDKSLDKKKKRKKAQEFEYCKACKLNHNQGRSHVYFPNHKKSLSSFLSRFRTKLSDVRFFLKNPSLLRPEHASRNRLWCVFCDFDVDEVGSSFACGAAINHLAGAEHLKNVKSFLWKYGGGMDCVDSFRVSEADLAKWEKKCQLLKSEVPAEGSRGPLIGPVNDIHNELNTHYVENLENANIHTLNSTFSNGVVPLPNYTNEYYQVSYSELSGVTEVGPFLHGANTYFYAGPQLNVAPVVPSNLTGHINSQQPVICNEEYSNAGCSGMFQVDQNEGRSNRESISQDFVHLAKISSVARDDAKGNVHSGAPPPWFDAAMGNTLDASEKEGSGPMNIVSPSSKSGKSKKLNPKRVGAAWAERRKIELEMEKRGELVSNNFDSNWLPNFGRVWQSGTRKESRKEFEVEHKKPQTEIQPETPIQLQPYISKRMRKGAVE